MISDQILYLYSTFSHSLTIMAKLLFDQLNLPNLIIIFNTSTYTISLLNYSHILNNVIKLSLVNPNEVQVSLSKSHLEKVVLTISNLVNFIIKNSKCSILSYFYNHTTYVLNCIISSPTTNVKFENVSSPLVRE